VGADANHKKIQTIKEAVMADIINLSEKKGAPFLAFIEKEDGTVEPIDTKVIQRTIFAAISYMWAKYPQAAKGALLQLQKKDEYDD
jgi:hypothetical protein